MRRPVDPDEVVARLRQAPPRGVIARGQGRAYGDAAQNAGGEVLDLGACADVDLSRLADDGTIVAQAGATLDAIVRATVPRGFFIPVAPGTRQVSVGGAIAADVHGKDHHVRGTIAAHVTRLRIATPVGVREVGPADDLFAATCGGMGLTGVVLDATLKLLPIPSSHVVVDTDRGPGLDDVMAAMSEATDDRPYSVAWVDAMTRGAALGRGIVTRGRWARADEAAREPLDARSLPLPPALPVNLLSRPAAEAFGALWFAKAPRRRRDELQRLTSFFHPLDALRGWNVVYGPGGVVQYQFVVPLGAADVVRRVLEMLAVRRVPSALAVLKRFGPRRGGPLSFPIPGWTLAVDVPARTPGLAAVLDACDALVAEHGGRVYLAKDARLRRELLPVMYPELVTWRAVRAAHDPDGVLRSDLGRRLGLDGGER